MKKTFITLSLLVITILMVCVLSASASVKGDVDGNGEVTASDARLALRMSVNLESKKDAADADNNGSITASDARLILRASVGLEKLEEKTTIEVEETTTEKVVTQPEETTTKQEETITAAPVININKMGGEYSPERAGLLYNHVRALSTYEEIKEGNFYYEYDENGNLERKQKPYSPGNEPEPETCDFCGKLVKPYDGKHYGCYYDGYCDRFYVDINCPECGEFVNANTCHSCK